MLVEQIRIEQYRSVRDLTFDIGPLNVVLGPNGSGKSNLYRALALLPAAGEGGLARALLRDGGMPSALWAGRRPTKKQAFQLRLQVTWEDLVFELACGVTSAADSAFRLDPEVQEERLLSRGPKPIVWMERKRGTVRLRAADASTARLNAAVDPAESVVSQVRDPERYPHLAQLQQVLRQWRFYHHFRTDSGAMLRRVQAGVRTPGPSPDGSDLAAVLATICETPQGAQLQSAIEMAFPGQTLDISGPPGRFQVGLQDEAFQRPFLAHQLSDGTLQFLCLMAVLLSPRPPLLLALNEPETSLHPRLYEPLAHLVVDASARSQVWLTTHARELTEHIRKLSGVRPIELEKVEGETLIVGQSRFGVRTLMQLHEIRIENYRSIKDLVMPMQPLTVVVGPNGCGKTNLYQALTLLQAASQGRFAQAILDGGGMPSVLWAGRRSVPDKPVRMRLDVTWEDCRYYLRCGLPQPQPDEPWFKLDPEVKEEQLVCIENRRSIVFMDRDHGSLWVRDTDGARIKYPFSVPVSEAALSQIREPDRYPEFSRVRELFRGWRFYHHFPTHDAAPARQIGPSIRTTVLSEDGHDLGSALGTIVQIGDGPRLFANIERTFPGQKLMLGETEENGFRLALQDPRLQRPLETQELSDGTLQYLCLVAALLTPRPPLLMAFNEPETSLHPRLYEPLARLLVEAAEHSQIWLTTHAQALADHVRKLSGATPLELEKVDGETRIVGRTRFGFER